MEKLTEMAARVKRLNRIAPIELSRMELEIIRDSLEGKKQTRTYSPGLLLEKIKLVLETTE